MSEPIRHSFDAPNIDGNGEHHLSYVEWPNESADKTLVCVHGLTRNARDFDFVAHALKKDYRIIAIDIAGRGHSAPLSDISQYNYVTYMLDCIALIEHLQIKPVHWLGTSMGGIIGMMIAALHKGTIERMVMNDIGATVPAEGLKRIVQYIHGAPRQFESREAITDYMRDIFAPFGIREDTHWQHLFAHSIIDESGVYRFAYDPDIIAPVLQETDNGQHINDIDLSDLWQEVHIPTLILRGKESDILPQSVAYTMLETNEQAELVEIDHVGHAPALMEEAQVALVAEWLKAE